MEIWGIFVLLFFISFVLALFALRKELSKIREVEEVKEELKKERVLFYVDKEEKKD